MKAIELEMPDELYRKLERMASHDHQRVDTFARQKLEELVGAVENFAELERRAQRGNIDKFRAAMAKVPSVPPMPGDELPR
jgi:predicted DNA-binding protein